MKMSLYVLNNNNNNNKLEKIIQEKEQQRHESQRTIFEVSYQMNANI